jgi:NADPH2 dehydrogenase
MCVHLTATLNYQLSTFMSTSKLFHPVKVGHFDLKHHIVLAPLTRQRANPATAVPQPNAKVYYAQRASAPGTLLITEGTFIAAKAGGLEGVPGIWSDEQISAWKEV